MAYFCLMVLYSMAVIIEVLILPLLIAKVKFRVMQQLLVHHSKQNHRKGKLKPFAVIHLLILLKQFYKRRNICLSYFYIFVKFLRGIKQTNFRTRLNSLYINIIIFIIVINTNIKIPNYFLSNTI